MTIVNPAIGGTQLRQNLVLMPRWLAQAPRPDLVTFFFGGNDWEAGMRGPQFRESCADAVDRTRRATKGSADVLLMTTAPSRKRMSKGELAQACRAAARDRSAGLADAEAAILDAAKLKKKQELFVWDAVHLGQAGHEAVARAVQEAIESGGVP